MPQLADATLECTMPCLAPHAQVYNEREDFYDKVATGTFPEFDVLVTNREPLP